MSTLQRVMSPHRHDPDTVSVVFRVAAALAALVLWGLVAAGCGSHGPRSGVKAAIETRIRHCSDGARVPLGSPKLAFAAVVRRPLHAFHAPGRKPFAAFGRLNVNRVPTVFSVLGAIVTRSCEVRWYHVELPLKPNGITGWTQGGPIAIHGTNEPWSIGHDVSNGCIRLPNATLKRLFDAVPAGTPVVIRA